MGDNIIPGESEAWNVAKGFSNFHVLVPLIECRKLVKVCLFGVEEIGQEYEYSNSVLNQNKINALNRLLQELKQICDDNCFIMDKQTIPLIERLKTRLAMIEKYVGDVGRKNVDERQNLVEIELNEELYNLCLNELRDILSEVKKPLNLKNLIFGASSDYDIEKIKKEIIEGG